jgi:hypothetical protein
MSRRDRLVALGQWLVLGSLVGVLTGSASALFLWLLELATSFRTKNELVVYTLPVAGLAIGWVYERYGKPIAGNNLIIDTIHDDGPEIPLRMAPMVLVGTVLTHVFGGSAGREGTAVQMGASLSDWLSHRLRVSPEVRRQLLAAGVAGGFGSVFGTPVAGAVFGLEFIVLGRIEYVALVPALVASLVGDLTAHALGTAHTHLPGSAERAALADAAPQVARLRRGRRARDDGVHRAHAPPQEARRALRAAPALAHVLRRARGRGAVEARRHERLPRPRHPDDPARLRRSEPPGLRLRAQAGVHRRDDRRGLPRWRGHAALLRRRGARQRARALLGIPIELGAGVGLAAVFAAASNTPLALSIMAVELLGAPVFPHVVIVCVVAYLLSGHRSIYPSQRLFTAKGGTRLGALVSLRDLPSEKPPPGSKRDGPEADG